MKEGVVTVDELRQRLGNDKFKEIKIHSTAKRIKELATELKALRDSGGNVTTEHIIMALGIAKGIEDLEKCI